MAAIERTVRHLRLRAPSQAAAQRLVTTLEDALRCASLHDEGARLLVVKNLALGRIPAGISPQALALRIEACTARAAGLWVDADTPASGAASCVAFASPLHARTALAQRLLRGQDCEAWYWRSAVPEFEARASVSANLRAIAWELADWPEVRVALAAWVRALVQAGGAAKLKLCMRAEEGQALLQRAGVAVGARSLPGQRGPDLHRGQVRRLGAAPPPPRAREPAGAQTELPAWLDALLEISGSNAASRHAPFHVRAAVGALSPALRRPRGGGGPPSPGPQPAGDLARADGAGPLRGSRPSRSPGGAQLAREQDAPAAPARPSGTREQAHVREATRAADAEPWLQPTTCGGLLFLLPVLERLGLPGWLPPDDDCFARLVLSAALLRLRAPADDPMRLLLEGASRSRASPARAAPACWSDPLLAPPRGQQPLTLRLAYATTAAQQAQAWLAATRYWLRRAGCIGLASLVLRPASLALTATHADVVFALAQTDVRVRRLGLDLDPGWVPWFGRVVNFHYAREPA